ncbi:MAG TPA: sigma-54 dependent transcriptional regulator [Chitinophagaceae bacterium]|nr:sigma-54 dependent transcriptional regulator [Chitinophagaceae bacterium]
MEKILIVEDELIVARDIRRTLEKAHYKIVGVARSVSDAQVMLRQAAPQFVLLDIFLKGDLTGIDFARQLNQENIPFVYISANSNQQVLEAAKTTDPYGFIVKPFREKDLLVTLDIARYRHDNNKQMNIAAGSTTTIIRPITSNDKSALAGKKQVQVFDGLVGASAAMVKVYRLIDQVAPFDTSVLLLGESGTGKEVVARHIVQGSARSTKPFIKINCAAIPRDLMEAELFGYEKGSFTGAHDRKAGKFEMANGGTILLDEIGDMPLDMQAKLLRVLQEKEVQRIGSASSIKVDIRVIAATNKNLEREAGEGRFRLDLYYRLHVFPIMLPPLRERKEDIPLLAHHFLAIYAGKVGKPGLEIDNKAIQKLQLYAWPGNVRELQHRIERAVLLATDNTITDL